MPSALSSLDQEIAQLLGIQEYYVNNSKGKVSISIEVFEALVKELCPSHLDCKKRDEDFLSSLWQWRYERPLKENQVVWSGQKFVFQWRVFADKALPDLFDIELECDNGEKFSAKLKPDNNFSTLQMPSVLLPNLKVSHTTLETEWLLPPGYHSLSIKADGQIYCSQVICAPESLEPLATKSWGVFVPTYALRGAQSWGAGSYSDLKDLCLFVAEKGAKTVATLPLLPAFVEEWKNDPSPYSPASRMFWNDFYVDPTVLPEWENSVKAQKIFEESKSLVESWEAQDWVQYLEIAKFKQNIMSELSREFFKSADFQSRLASALAQRPLLKEYALFRAYCTQTQSSWWSWDEKQKLGQLSESDVDSELYGLHLYSQLAAIEQLGDLAEFVQSKGLSFYLDLPVGVHADSFDVWKNKELYCLNLCAGAPPDPFFTKGQNWGFPPLHPQNLHKNKFQHLKDFVRHHFSEASLLRLDHVMGLHRLYVIPQGFEAHEGAYIRYPFEELYAIFMLEASRAGAHLVGEDLGTVPEEVRIKMNQHELNRLFVFQYEAQENKENVVSTPDSNTVASLNTHDMPLWASYWRALDLDDRRELGLLTDEQKLSERKSRSIIKESWLRFLREEKFFPKEQREFSEIDVLCATYRYLASSPACLVLLNLEDVYLETRPQNTPGTYKERPNWQGRMAKNIETLCSDKVFYSLIEILSSSRRDALTKSC